MEGGLPLWIPPPPALSPWHPPNHRRRTSRKSRTRPTWASGRADYEARAFNRKFTTIKNDTDLHCLGPCKGRGGSPDPCMWFGDPSTLVADLLPCNPPPTAPTPMLRSGKGLAICDGHNPRKKIIVLAICMGKRYLHTFHGFARYNFLIISSESEYLGLRYF